MYLSSFSLHNLLNFSLDQVIRVPLDDMFGANGARDIKKDSGEGNYLIILFVCLDKHYWFLRFNADNGRFVVCLKLQFFT